MWDVFGIHRGLSRQTASEMETKSELDCNCCWNMNMFRDTVKDAVIFPIANPMAKADVLDPRSSTYQGSVITCSLLCVKFITAWLWFPLIFFKMSQGICELLVTLRISYKTLEEEQRFHCFLVSFQFRFPFGHFLSTHKGTVGLRSRRLTCWLWWWWRGYWAFRKYVCEVHWVRLWL